VGRTAGPRHRAPGRAAAATLPAVRALPVRGAAVHELGLPLPPAPMPAFRGARPLKRWRYVGVFGPELMLCVGDARIGPVPRRWWAVAEPDGTLHERSTVGRGGVRFEGGRLLVDAPGVRIELELDDGDGIEVVSPHGDSWIWTRKQGGVPARGRVWLGGREHAVDAEAVVDDSAGYHARRTAWRWSAGVGRGADGEPVAWNLVSGMHDGSEASERTVWVGGEPREVGPVEFADDLGRISFADGGALDFTEWCAREERIDLLLLRSRYRQPFGTFTGELPGGPRVAEGFGVMEEHDVRW
jgi:Protein of unknown function (DUF2804)